MLSFVQASAVSTVTPTTPPPTTPPPSSMTSTVTTTLLMPSTSTDSVSVKSSSQLRLSLGKEGFTLTKPAEEVTL